jgi:hypothetical protein
LVKYCYHSGTSSDHGIDFPSDIEVAMAHTPKNVATLASEIGVLDSELELYGKSKAKISLDILERLAHRKDGKYVVVAGFVDYMSSSEFWIPN